MTEYIPRATDEDQEPFFLEPVLIASVRKSFKRKARQHLYRQATRLPAASLKVI
jgi:hypothetical protein